LILASINILGPESRGVALAQDSTLNDNTPRHSSKAHYQLNLFKPQSSKAQHTPPPRYKSEPFARYPISPFHYQQILANHKPYTANHHIHPTSHTRSWPKQHPAFQPSSWCLSVMVVLER
jgi:hypothetical protein